MRILSLSYERNLELAERGHEIMYLDINRIEKEGWCQVFADLMAFEPIDLVIEREFNDGRAIYDGVLKHLHTPAKAWWWIDSHVGWERGKEYAKHFDYIFMAISAHIEPLKTYLGHDRVYHLPLCWPYRSDLIAPNSEPKEYELSFVGRWKEFAASLPQRSEYIAFLKEKLGERFYAVTDYQNMLSIVRRSKVSFNYSVLGDMNFRTFEVLGCGTELLTNDVPDLRRIAGLEQRLVIYKDKDDLLDLTNRLLGGDESLCHDTLSNQQWVKEHHSLINRHLSLLRMIEGGAQEQF